MEKGDYFYYKDNRYEYILKITGNLDFQKPKDICLKIIKCSNSKFNEREAVWNCTLLLHDCKEMKILTEAKALAMAL